MANKQALRDLQHRLAQRLLAARTELPGDAWLAVEAGGHGFLLPLKEAGEIFSLAPVLPVPHCRHWFLGVANLRGHLHGVVDLADFLGLSPGPLASTAPGAGRSAGQGQFVGFNAALDLNCVLRIERLAGLRNADQLSPLAGAFVAKVRPGFAGARLRDASGRLWQELNLAALAADATFLNVAA